MSLSPTPETDVIILRGKSFIFEMATRPFVRKNAALTVPFQSYRNKYLESRSLYNKCIFVRVIFRYYFFFFFPFSLQLILVAGQNDETVMNKFHLLANIFYSSILYSLYLGSKFRSEILS